MSAKHNDKQEKESTEEDEKQVLLQKYKEMHAAFEAKLITRIANLAAHSSRAALKANLDSNLKKTSAFVRKVKVFSESHKDASLFTDLEKLNLVKFVEEIATSLADAKLARVSDINAAVKFSSIMHQKYDQYAQILDSEILSKLEDLFSQILNPPTDQDNSVASRLRSLMRFYSELSWVGVFQSADKFVSTMRKAILKDDLHDQLYVFCSVMATFLKNSGEEFCDIIPTKQKSEETAIGVDHFKKPEFIKANMKSDFLQSCKLYYEKLCQELKGIFEEIKKQSRINKKLEFYKGSVGDANLLKLKDLADRFERLQQNLIIFADSLDLKIPQYSLKEAVESIEEEKSEADAKVDQSGVFDVSKAIFDDPESRAFYEVLPALKLIIPAVLLEEGGGKADLIGGKLVNKKQPVSLKNRAIDVVIDDNIADTDFGEEDFDEEELNSNFTLTESSSSNSPFDVFLKSLNDVSSKSECDKLAEQFCHLNNKGNKKKLLDFLLNANKFRNDILPFYARIIATLSQCFSEIGEAAIYFLKRRFYGLIRSKKQYNVEMKMRTARYIGELVKFKIAHHSVAFNCWNFCMKDFGSQTVYIVSALLESCGRWLYRNSETNSRCQEFLERMMKLKVGKFFDDNLKMTIDNAYYSCIPQERTITPRKIYPLIHQYIRKLLFVDLKNVSTIIAVVEHLLRLEWDSDCFFIIRNAFLEIENIEYSNLDLMAQVIYHLNKFTNIGVLLLDDIIEEIQYGMEINNFWEYQQRIAFARYFAELYNSRIASSKVVFSVMYLLLNFGHDFSKEGTSESKLDTPRDTIRIRLITTILEHTGKQLDQQNRNELSLFLLHFQRYILQKELIPVDLEFLLDDLFTRLRPSMSRFRNMKDCDEEISKLQSVIKSDGIKDQPQLQPSDELKYMDTADLKNDSEIKFTELDDDSGGDEEEDDDEEEEQEEDEDEEDEEYPDDNELEDDEEENAKAYDWSHRGLQNRTVGNSVEDEEFLRQLDNTFVEDVESRKFESRTIRNLVDAETLAIQALSKSSRASETKSQQASDLVRGFVPMQFLTRRNKGILARQIEVPEAEKIVENLGSADHAANHKKEQLLMKKLVQAGINRTADDH